MSLKDELGTKGIGCFAGGVICRWSWSHFSLSPLPRCGGPWGALLSTSFGKSFAWWFLLPGWPFASRLWGTPSRGTSGRIPKRSGPEHSSTTGVYSVVRHPLYLGNYLIGLGAVLVPFEFWFFSLYTLLYWLYYERIMMAEERFLVSRFGDSFEEWAKQTPAFIPRMSQWIPPRVSL